MAFPKIMEHPDKNRIVKWLRDGKGVRWVSKQLKEMYPDDKSKQLSVPTLQDFRKEKIVDFLINLIYHMKASIDVCFLNWVVAKWPVSSEASSPRRIRQEFFRSLIKIIFEKLNIGS